MLDYLNPWLCVSQAKGTTLIFERIAMNESSEQLISLHT